MGNHGKLIWITGLSGAGKTTIAKEVYGVMKQQNLDFIHLDGDNLRNVLGELASFSTSGRKRTAEIYARLCTFLTEQGINVVISTISLYHSVHEYNRRRNKNYFEILLEVDRKVLEKRNKRGLYNPGATNVMGLDQDPEFPTNPDLILKNNSKNQLEENIHRVVELVSVTKQDDNVDRNP